MRAFLLLLAAASSAALAAPPRQESPANPETLRSFGQGSSDEAMARAIEAANAHPLGTLQNPIRVGGPDDARRYVSTLRCTDGTTPRIAREAPGSIGAFGTLTTMVTLACGSTTNAPLAFDFYQEEYRETRPAPGFQIAP